MAKILIKNGRVWDGERFFYADVLTNEDRIEKIEPNITDEAFFVCDAKGKIVSAGLVDLHVHMRLLPTDPFGIPPEMSCFPFGVTAAVDAGRNHGEKTVIDSLMLKSLVLVATPIRENQVDFDEIERSLARFGEKAIGIKVYFDAVASGVTDITPLREICAFAKARALRVMVHCSHSPTPMSEILETLGEGDILTHAFHGDENTADADGFESLKSAQARGVIIDSGFAGHMHTDFGVFQKAISAGVLPDTISTDITKFSAYTRGGRYGMTTCMSLAKHAGMSEEEIFRSVTSTPARVLGKGNEWGHLQVGGVADIAVFDYTDEGYSLTDIAGNHVESDTGYRCVLTVSDGQVVYRN